MGLYNTLSKKEQEIYDAGAKSALDDINTAVEIVSSYNPTCTTIRIRDFYKMIDVAKEKYN